LTVAVRDVLLRRAAEARRESQRVEFRDDFEPDVELVRDVAALANSGGGVVVFGERVEVDVVRLRAELERYTGADATLETHEVARNGVPVAALLVLPVEEAPIVFAEDSDAFARGSVYFRHGSKSTPATSADLRKFVGRRLGAVRRQWLGSIRQAMAVVETAAREATEPSLVRLTVDPSAPVYGQLDPDITHPHRQKDVIRETSERLPDGVSVNQHDILSIRRIYEISEATHPEFTHEPKFTSPQYSDAFVDWLVQSYARDPQFFADAKARYNESVRARRTRSS
jgi:hypothetical protein